MNRLLGSALSVLVACVAACGGGGSAIDYDVQFTPNDRRPQKECDITVTFRADAVPAEALVHFRLVNPDMGAVLDEWWVMPSETRFTSGGVSVDFDGLNNELVVVEETVKRSILEIEPEWVQVSISASDLHLENGNGDNRLDFALRDQDADAALKWIRAGLDVDRWALGEAVKLPERRTDVVQAIISSGVDVVDSGGTPLHVAVYTAKFADLSDAVDTIQALVDAGIDVNSRGGRVGNVAMHEVLSLPDPYSTGVVEALVGAGADINAVNNEGHTPLHVGCLLADSFGYFDGTLALLRAGADASLKDLRMFQRQARTYERVRGENPKIREIEVELLERVRGSAEFDRLPEDVQASLIESLGRARGGAESDLSP